MTDIVFLLLVFVGPLITAIPSATGIDLPHPPVAVGEPTDVVRGRLLVGVIAIGIGGSAIWAVRRFTTLVVTFFD